MQENGFLTPFSAVRNEFAPLVVGTFFITANDAIAYLDDGASPCAYSPILNRCIPAPTVTPTSYAVVRDAVVLATATGYEALSARHGHWVPLQTTLLNSYTAPNSGACFVAFDGNNDVLHVFDARLDRWASVTGQGSMTVNTSRHTVMAHDGTRAYGFGQPSGEWHDVALTAFPTAFRTSSSIGSVQHGQELSVYSVQGSFTYTGRYPEFTQAINLGNTIVLHQTAPAGSVLLRGFAFGPAHIDISGLGVLYLDPAGASIQFLGAPVPASGFHESTLTIPNNPLFAGAQLHMQDLVVPPVGQPWLSNSVAPVLF